MRDPESLPYTTYRISLMSGILGSVGATLAWLFWLAFRTGDKRMVGTVLIGAALGLAVEWTQHYVNVARRESQGTTQTRVPGLSRSGRMLGWAAGMGFLGLVAEHLVAHMAQEFLIPFLASLVTLLPAGILIGWTMSRGAEKDENLVMMVANGILIGVAIALVTGVLWLFSFGTAPWVALFAWWGLIGIGTRMVANPGRHTMSPADPVVAVVLIFVLTLLINLLPATRSSYAKLGPLAPMTMQVRAMAAEIELSPAVPSTFWKAAELEFKRLHPDPRDTVGKTHAPKVAVPPAPSAAPHLDLPGAVGRLVGPDSSAVEGAPAARWDAAEWAEFLRSWMVILFFAIGVGYAPLVERSLRPVDYPNSETYRRDLLLTAVVLGIVVASCLTAHAVSGATH
jgi:hypothetical protein